MAYLTKEERSKLLDELSRMSFRKARGRLRGMDHKGRLAYYRNAQATDKWMTKYVLSSLGTEVTLVESNRYKDKLNKANRVSNDYDLIEVIVEPTPDNRL